MGKSVHEIITAISEMSDMSEADKVYMFIQLCDEKQLMAELNKQTMMLQIGIVPESLIHGFAYGVLSLAKPHLFEKEQQVEQG